MSPSRSWISTSLDDLLLDCDLGAFLRVGSALDYTGTLVKDVTIGSKLLHAASASHFAGIDSLEYGNSTLELDNSALEYGKSSLDYWESTSLGNLLLDCDFDAFLKVGSALDYTETVVRDVIIGSKLLHAASASHFAGIDSLEYGDSTLE